VVGRDLQRHVVKAHWCRIVTSRRVFTSSDDSARVNRRRGLTADQPKLH
jgi:hypothetical protein